MTHDTTNQITPPHRPGLLYRIVRARRVGRLIVLIIAIGAALEATSRYHTNTSHPLSTPSSLELTALPISATAPPTDTITLTLTWDEWQDIQDCIGTVSAQITVTLDFAADTLPPATVNQAYSTHERLRNLADKLIDDAEIQTWHIPGEQMQTILDHQLDRSATFSDLMLRLFDARISYFTSPNQAPKKKP